MSAWILYLFARLIQWKKDWMRMRCSSIKSHLWKRLNQKSVACLTGRIVLLVSILLLISRYYRFWCYTYESCCIARKICPLPWHNATWHSIIGPLKIVSFASNHILPILHMSSRWAKFSVWSVLILL